MTNHSYKIYQLMLYFVSKFSYKAVNIRENKKEELWLANPKNSDYPIIRITTNTIEQVIYEEDYINEILKAIQRTVRIAEPRFLDIHIGHDEIYEEEIFDSIAIDSDYYDGLDLSPIFPGIRSVVHEVSDPNAEINAIFMQLKELTKVERRQRNALKNHGIYVTYGVMAICIVVFLMHSFLSQSYSSTAASVITGADYKMFTLGLGQFWRLITVAFNHSGLLHLVLNLYCLYIAGSFLEKELGHAKFALLLFLSILTGSLTYGIFTGNNLSVGLSGGLYGVMTMYIMWAYSNGLMHKQTIIQIVLINLFINFMPSVGFLAHLGGLVTGVIFYYIFYNPKLKKQMIILLTCFMVFLGVKYLTQKTIRPIYAGTDAEVVQIYRDFGWDGYADKLEHKLFEVYTRSLD